MSKLPLKRGRKKISFLDRHLKTMKIIMINWALFAMLLASFTMYMLLREIKSLRQDNSEMATEITNLKSNLTEIEKQYPASEIILKLKK
jgi:cell division protein FtsL